MTVRDLFVEWSATELGIHYFLRARMSSRCNRKVSPK